MLVVIDPKQDVIYKLEASHLGDVSHVEVHEGG